VNAFASSRRDTGMATLPWLDGVDRGSRLHGRSSQTRSNSVRLVFEADAAAQ
jgi:hypothetical protein